MEVANDTIDTPLHEQVYAALKQQIMEGRYLPGESISINSVTQALGTSTMPVRDAMRRLASEGALVILPKRAATIPMMTHRQFQDIGLARVALEGLATEMACELMTQTVIDDLDAQADAMEVIVDEGRWRDYATANQLFHFSIYAQSGSEVLMPLIENLWLRMGPFMNLWGTVGIGVGRDRHHDAIAALRRGDGKVARAVIEADINAGVDFVLANGGFAAAAS